MNCSRCHTRVIWRENGRTIVEGTITNISGVTYVECTRCGKLEWSRPEASATERTAQGIETYVGTPKQLSTLFWVLIVGAIVTVLFGLIMYRSTAP